MTNKKQSSTVKPVAYADWLSFESAMKSGKGCDVWPTAGDYEARTGRMLVALYAEAARPLTDQQIEDARPMMCEPAAFAAGVRFAERLRGIGQSEEKTKGQTPGSQLD